MYDAAIVGGSLAGALTAHYLASAGLRVVVLERDEGRTRPRACGEGLLPGGVRELERAGLGDALAAHSAIFRSVAFHVGGVTATATLPKGVVARGVRRDILDPMLLELAVRSGVEVRRGASVTRFRVEHGLASGITLASGEEVPARVVVGADGLHSRIRRLARLDAAASGNRYGVSIHVALDEPPPERVDVYFRPGHELYLTPTGEREMNVAILAAKPFLGQFAGELDATFARFLRNHPDMPAGWSTSSAAAVRGPFAVRARRAWRGNVVLVGDAAGFLDGITGEGMSVALVSARHCAEAVMQYLDRGTFAPFRTYQRRRAALARNSEWLGRLTLQMGPHLTLARLAARNLARRPATFDRLLAFNAGEAGLSSLRPRDIVALATGF